MRLLRGRLAGIRRPQSVRVRIMLVAALITAAAVASGGWLLVRSVEDSQLGDLRRDTEDVYQQLAHQLSNGTSLNETSVNAGIGTGFVSVKEEGGAECSFVVLSGDGGGSRMASATQASGSTSVVGQTGGADDTSSVCPEPPPDRTSEPLAADAQAASECPEGVGQVVPAPSTDADAPEPGTADVLDPCLGMNPEGDPGAEPGSDPEDALRGYDIEMITGNVETPTGDVVLTVATPVDQVARSVAAIRNTVFLGVPGIVGLVMVAAWLLVGRALRPVDLIRAEADAIGGSTLDRRVPEPDSDDEVGRLAHTMNAMLGRLDSSAQRQRQFVADASHELRSPLAAIRTDLEVALLEGDKGDWRESVRGALRQEARLETLIRDLLLLATDDENAATLPDSPVDLTELAAEEVDRPRRVPVRFDRPNEVFVSGAGRQLQRIMANLVDNAARHAESEVRVTLERVDDRVQLVVDDDGPGIPAADRERVFERFTRLDDGRARDQGGAGLGLAVVDAIVTRHGGTVHVDDSPIGGARLVVSFPPRQ